MDVDKWVRTAIKNLSPYKAKQKKGIRLDANTNQFMPNPVTKNIPELLEGLELNHYPDPEAGELKKAIAEQWSADADNVLVSNGSDEIIDLIIKSFIEPGDRIAFPVPSFVMYDFYSVIAGARLMKVPLDQDMSPQVEGLLAIDPKIIILASPNNPTGNSFSKDDILQLAEGTGGIVLLDQAYAEFSGESPVTDHDNVICLRTFSKAYGLAGIRAGYALAPPDIIDVLNKTRSPYNLDAVAQVTAASAIRDKDYVARVKEMCSKVRKETCSRLSSLPLKVYPSNANFLYIEIKDKAGDLVSKMEERGYHIRGLDKDHIRITLAHPDIMEPFMAQFEDTVNSLD